MEQIVILRQKMSIGTQLYINLEVMKKLIIFISIVLFSGCSSSYQLDEKIKDNINYIVENERVIMTFEIYKSDVAFMNKKYNIEICNPEINDITKNKLSYEMCVNDIYLAIKDSSILKERDKVIDKWIKNNNYNPKLHFVFENENKHYSSLSFLKAMDFYKSDDLNNYLDLFRKEIVAIYLSKQNLDIIPCIENEKYSNWKIWKMDSLKEIKIE